MLYLAVRNNSLKRFQVNFKPCFACVGTSNITSFGKVKNPVWRNNVICWVFGVSTIVCSACWFIFYDIHIHQNTSSLFRIINSVLINHFSNMASLSARLPNWKVSNWKWHEWHNGITKASLALIPLPLPCFAELLWAALLFRLPHLTQGSFLISANRLRFRIAFYVALNTINVLLYVMNASCTIIFELLRCI